MGLQLVSKNPGGKDIYVSISKQADKLWVKTVLRYLSSMSGRVWTYDGSNYNIKDLNNMEILIVIAPSLRPNHNTAAGLEYIVGKGQFEEIQAFVSHRGSSNAFIVTELIGDLELAQINKVAKLAHIVDWENYGLATTYNVTTCIEYYDFSRITDQLGYVEADQDYLARLDNTLSGLPTIKNESLVEKDPHGVPIVSFHLALAREFI